ncbi:MAG: hypothetical protein LUF78_10835 [Clostridiales bacterium]|nr:hypothetical protein [Clostridiales bacterium]
MAVSMNLKKTIHMTGQIMVDSKNVAYVQANISADSGVSNLTTTVQNQSLYASNITDVRAQIEAFMDELYAAEDATIAENSASETEAE